jgi:hypothetical protein
MHDRGDRLTGFRGNWYVTASCVCATGTSNDCDSFFERRFPDENERLVGWTRAGTRKEATE